MRVSNPDCFAAAQARRGELDAMIEGE